MNFWENLVNNNKFLNLHFQKIKTESKIKWFSQKSNVAYYAIYNIGSDLLKARLDTQYLGTFMVDP